MIDSADPDERINAPTARRLAGDVSDMTLWRWTRKGIIPPPDYIEGRRYWRRRKFLAALDAAARRSEQEARHG
ncbi:hypothetical protein [uncultured Thiohalocapsa sp.]|uniref:hypothetical protein n=1 Tax=uncultured Thiohalocapsa sp. TaxID=768990 RepID=UPI0025EEA9B8|nr:hypothetical protein [uncultured Thiohalocapsa sp.]